MRIAILTTQCPFVIGGAELHAESLERVLREAGHEAEIVSMPFKWYPSTTILDHMLAARSMDVSEFNGVKIDLAICLKFPAYLMRHPNKVYWILHQHRQSYDMWDSGLSDLFDDENGGFVRDAIRESDNVELRGAKGVFANSANVAKRLLHYNNVVAEPLYHPPPLADRLTRGEFGDYFYYPSRLSKAKRQDFVLRSLAVAEKNVRVVFSGAPDNPEYGDELKRLARELGVEDRVEWRGFVSNEEMIGLYARARGVIFTPVDEDLGYIALEAMLAGKPLLTLSDTGEPAALTRDGTEGFVVSPEPAALADAMNRLANSKELAHDMGDAAYRRYKGLDISWANVVARLTEKRTSPRSAPVVDPRSEELSMRMNLAGAKPSMVIIDSLKVEHVGPNDLKSSLVRSDSSRPSPAKIENLPPASTNESDVAIIDIPFEDLGRRYEIDALGHDSYYKVHWPRYRASLKTIARAAIKPKRILELGTSKPYAFTALLKENYPDAEFCVVQENPAGGNWRDKIKGQGERVPDINLSVYGLNLETDRLPFADNEFDLVVAMEILEHFAIDPSFVFREANRVLRDGGVFLATTPNLVSLQALGRGLNGVSPYSFGVFVPANGAYGRHNREYTPREVESLGRYGGFETLLVHTEDIYHQDEVPSSLVDYMSRESFPLDLRGQNIFYLGRKNLGATPAPFPENLFEIDPAIFSGKLELRPKPGLDDIETVRMTNESPLVWRAEGCGRVRLTVDKIAQNGQVSFDALQFELPGDMAPGDVGEIFLKVIRGVGLDGCWHEIGLFIDGVGPFKGAGRTRTLRLFAEGLELAPQSGLGFDAA
jgi:glycosyltransferase involved in cell wall biosynthesis/SAM-dependent methyltransferase